MSESDIREKCSNFALLVDRINKTKSPDRIALTLLAFCEPSVKQINDGKEELKIIA